MDNNLLELEAQRLLDEYKFDRYAYMKLYNILMSLQEDKNNMQKIVNLSEEFLQMSDEQIDYQKITDELLQISKSKYVILNLYDESGDYLTTKAISGQNESLIKAADFLGFSLINKKWKHDYVREEKIKYNITNFFSSLHDLCGNVIQRSLIIALENIFKLGEVILVKIFRDNLMIGDFTIVMQKDSKYENKNSVEIFTRQIGMLILRKRAEEALRESENKYKYLVTQMQQGLAVHEVVCDEFNKVIDYRFLDVNESYERLTGLKREEILGRTVLDLLPETENYWIEKFGHVAMTGEPLKYDNYSKELGKYFEVVAYRPRPKQFAVIISDITDRKRSEDRIRKNERMLSALATATNELLTNKEYFDAISKSLDWIGEATGIECVCLYKNFYNTKQELEYSSQKLKWFINKFKGEISNTEYQNIPVDELSYFIKAFNNKRLILKKVNEMEEGLIKESLTGTKLTTVVGIPIYTRDYLWGFILFGESINNNVLKPTEISLLETFVGSVSKAIERKIDEEEIEYLSYYDSLTGLYNRRFLEIELKRLDKSRNLPVSIIVADVNGLKLTNDAFGHMLGDKLLINVAKVLKKACRSDDIIARWGGDEFIILLPKTSSKEAEEICYRINNKCKAFTNNPISISISLGYSSKNSIEDNIMQVLKIAEDKMYKRKLLESGSIRSNIIDSMRKTLYEKSHETEKHAARIKDLCYKTGIQLDLSEDELNELGLFALLHDIGKISIRDDIINKPSALTELERFEMSKHCEIGYKIARAVPDLVHIAEYIYTHHEMWNGKGYPRNLKGTEIPLLSRILSVVDAYDAMTNDRSYRKAMSKAEATQEILKNSGTQFDPQVVDVFINKVLDH